LNENYRIIQDTEYYRFTSDSILLSRFVKAKKGEVVADFCAGSGIVGLNFFAENEGVSGVVLFEIQRELAEMSRESVALNGLEKIFRVENCSLQEIPQSYCEAFSLILCNPPYERDGFENKNPVCAPCRKELSLTFGELAAAAKRCLKFGGRFVLIHRADRLAEIICTLRENNLEPKELQPVAGKSGVNPYAVMICAVKGGRQGIELLPDYIHHRQDGEKI